MSVAAPAGKKKIRGHCPNCGPNRWADEVAGFSKRDSDPSDEVWVLTQHRILECRACEAVFHQTDSVFSEDETYTYDPVTGEHYYDLRHTVTHWPSPLKRKRPDWLNSLGAADFDTYELLNAAYAALDADLNVLAAIGLRTAFDRATESFGIDAALGFGEKLSALQRDGYVGETEKDILSVLTDAGSAAAHRGWKPTAEQLDTMMSIVEGFLQRTMVLRREADDLKSAVPQKPKRLKGPNA